MARAMLDELLRCAARPPSDDDAVAFTGADPVFPIPLRVGEAGAAAIAATGVAASDLWQLRTGRRQRVTVGVRAAAAAMRSNRYARVAGDDGTTVAAAPDVRTPLSGFFRTRDERWVYLHCNFPHHRETIVSLLGCADDAEGVERAVAGRNAEELEEAIVARGACAGVVRTAAQWGGHEQAAAVGWLPLFEVLKIGDSPPEPLPPGDRPLAGIRALDLTRVLAGPTCARTLAEHGATVLRVGTDRLPNHRLHTIDTGHGKLSTILDLQDEGDTATLHELAKHADVFSQSYQPGSLAARGFSPEALARLRPGIVSVSLTAFGHEGPWRDRRGFDTLVQSVSGIVDEYQLDGRPRLLPVSALDYITGYIAAFATMVALARRAREGGSYLVRVSLAQTGRWLTGLGRVSEDAMASAAEDLPAEEIARLSTTTDGPFGSIEHLAPVVQLSETPARWERPAVPLGHHEAVWPD